VRSHRPMNVVNSVSITAVSFTRTTGRAAYSRRGTGHWDRRRTGRCR
jgi:hypothetical protein